MEKTEIDPESPEYREAYREASIHFLCLFQPALGHALAAKNPGIGYAQILFALGLEDRSMHEVAASLKVETACISKGAKEFVRENNLPVPSCMKSDKAVESYREARNKQLIAS